MSVIDANFGIITFTPHTSHPHSSLLIYTPAHPHILLLTRSGGGVMAWWSGGWLMVAWVHHHTHHRPQATDHPPPTSHHHSHHTPPQTPHTIRTTYHTPHTPSHSGVVKCDEVWYGVKCDKCGVVWCSVVWCIKYDMPLPGYVTS